MYFKWKDEFSVNVGELDRQHRKLFEIGGRISDLVMADDGFDHYDEIVGILAELADYAVYHFDQEEILMEQYGYPELESHKIEHMFFRKKLQKIESKDLDNMQREAVIELITFISDWIAGHILKTDAKYGAFFNSHGLR